MAVKSHPKLTGYVGGPIPDEDTECIFIISGIAQQDAPLVANLLALIVSKYEDIISAIHDGEGGIIIAS